MEELLKQGWDTIDEYCNCPPMPKGHATASISKKNKEGHELCWTCHKILLCKCDEAHKARYSQYERVVSDKLHCGGCYRVRLN